MKKNIIKYILFSAIALGVLLYAGTSIVKFINAPHVMTQQQEFERFSWQLTSKDGTNEKVTFSSSTINIANHKYSYTLSDDDSILNVKSGPLKGRYTLQDDGADYYLVNQKAKFHLSRE